jgi:hypothetical protein
MTTNSINAASNPALANNLVSQATAEPEKVTQPAAITPPLETLVNLPGGYVNAAGEVVKTAEVRELTGKDEEAITKASSLNKVFPTILNRGVVSVGKEKATEEMLDKMLAGDRDALLVGIYKATFGPTANLLCWCSGCNESKEVEVNVDTDITSKVLVDPVSDRTFTVFGKDKEYLCQLPTGYTQKEITANTDKSMAELQTILLEQTVLEINGDPVISKAQVQNLGILDRRKIGEEISNRAPGPKFDSVTIDCPDCGGKVVVPITLGALFQF